MIEMLSILIFLALLGGVFYLSTFFIATTFSCGAPFITTREDTAEKILKLAAITPSMKVADLGSGDGRMLFQFAKAGARVVHGYEINPLLVWKTRKRIARENLTDQVKVFRKNFWDADLSPYDVVYVYGIGEIMPKLEQKLRKELTPGAKVISQGFQFPEWRMNKKQGGVYIYLA